MNPKIGPHVHFRVEQIYFDTIRALALERNKTVSEYLRDEVVEPFLQAKAKEATSAQFAATSAQFIRHVKEYVDLAQLPPTHHPQLFMSVIHVYNTRLGSRGHPLKALRFDPTQLE